MMISQNKTTIYCNTFWLLKVTLSRVTRSKVFNNFLLNRSFQKVYISNKSCMTTVYSQSLNRSLMKKIILQAVLGRKYPTFQFIDLLLEKLPFS